MAVRRMPVAVAHQGSLLAEGVRALLAAAGGIEPLDIALDEDDAQERLRALDPAVVIVDADDEAFRSHPPTDLLERLPDACLVCLHGGGAHLDAYRKRRIELHGLRDLAAALGAV